MIFSETTMKAFTNYSRLLAATILTLGLGACGGYTSVDLGGSVTGLTTDGLVLANGGSTVTVPANATSYRFPSQIDDHGSYNITIQSQPARLTCGVASSSGTATGVAVNWANVVCAQNTYALSGTVTGLTGSGLVLANGPSQAAIAAGATTFVFPNRVADGSVYSVVVLTQPTNPMQTCTVSNGTDTMGPADVTNIKVNCI
jgi:hypothetical protein